MDIRLKEEDVPVLYAVLLSAHKNDHSALCSLSPSQKERLEELTQLFVRWETQRRDIDKRL